jgi:hypothetical protein
LYLWMRKSNFYANLKKNFIVRLRLKPKEF